MPHLSLEEFENLLPALLRQSPADRPTRLFFSGGKAEPCSLTAALGRQREAAASIEIVETRLPGFRTETYADWHDCRVTVTFLPRELQPAARRGVVRFVPLHYRDTWDWLAAQTFDVAFVEVTPPDAKGRSGFGLTADFAPAVLENSKCLIAEVNRALPDLPGAPRIELERFDYAVETERAPKATSPPAASETTAAIARHVATLVPDGACLQTGLGAIPDAVLANLDDRRGLGCHSGMIGDGMMKLASSGALDGSQKPLDRKLHVTGFVHGSQELYAWARDEPRVVLRTVDYTHDPRIISHLDGFIAINSAIEIDLEGQVNAETVRGQQISGVGGSIDFARGAARAVNGRSIIALPATARRGEVSRIVGTLPPETPVTASRNDVDTVVTEFGVAHLRGLSSRERAEALIGIAAPRFQPDLEASLR